MQWQKSPNVNGIKEVDDKLAPIRRIQMDDLKDDVKQNIMGKLETKHGSYDTMLHLFAAMCGGINMKHKGFCVTDRVLYWFGNRVIERLSANGKAYWFFSYYNQKASTIIMRRYYSILRGDYYFKFPIPSNVLITPMRSVGSSTLQEHFDQIVQSYAFLSEYKSSSRLHVQKKLEMLNSLIFMAEHREEFGIRVKPETEKYVVSGKETMKELGEINWKI